MYWRLNQRAQNIFLLVASYIFYGWWDWRFLGLMIASTSVDYLVAQKDFVQLPCSPSQTVVDRVSALEFHDSGDLQMLRRLRRIAGRRPQSAGDSQPSAAADPNHPSTRHLLFLEATGYYDWFYGLQRLFRQGSRPQVVVLGVGVNGFLANSARQDYVPRLLFDLEDSLGVAFDLAMDRTATSNLVLAHASVFWDTRSVIRTQILRHTIPRYAPWSCF